MHFSDDRGDKFPILFTISYYNIDFEVLSFIMKLYSTQILKKKNVIIPSFFNPLLLTIVKDTLKRVII